jgi:multidrug efflux pump subunit AcrA (membrane-fusion protein)
MSVLTHNSSRQRFWLACLVGIVLIGLLWQQVFAMTGVLWWNAPPVEEPVSAPAPLPAATVETGWVDLDAYLETHPHWAPR